MSKTFDIKSNNVRRESSRLRCPPYPSKSLKAWSKGQEVITSFYGPTDESVSPRNQLHFTARYQQKKSKYIL